MATYSKSEAQEWAWEALRGQWTTLFTPFTTDDSVDADALRHNIRHIRSLGTRGAGCTWGMGEFWSLTREERLRVMEVVADEAGGKWPIGAHVTHTSAKEMVTLAQRAESMGFDLLIVAPSYMVTKTEEQVIEYTRLLAESTSLAIMFYNSPQFGIVMSPQGLKRLCSIPNVVGVKEASFNQQTSIETHLLIGKEAIISTPDEWIFLKAKELGFRQQVMFANTSDWRFDTPDEPHYVRFIERATQGDLDEEYYAKHLRPLKDLSDKWWSQTMKKFGGSLPVPLVKYWGELMGLRAGHVRPPLADMSPAEKADLRRDLAALRSIRTDTSPSSSLPHSNGPVRAAAPGAQASSRASGGDATFSGMMLMVSVQNTEEAREADRGGADIIDVKNLQEALVGSGHPAVVQEVRGLIPAEKHVSVTLGVVPNQAGTVAMAVHAAATLHATSVKVGFLNTEYAEAVEILKDARRALKGSETKLIGSLFADSHLYGGLDARLMVRLAEETACDGFLIDTLTKDGRNLFDFLPEEELREIVFQGKKLGMSTALSGHLRLSDLDELARINPDIVGVRGAVCSRGDRETAVAWEAVAEFKRELELRKSGQIDVHARAQQPLPGNGTPAPANGREEGWILVDGRGKSCAGVIAALSEKVTREHPAFIETILGDVLNSYDVIVWAEQAGYRLLTKRMDPDGNMRLLVHADGPA